MSDAPGLPWRLRLLFWWRARRIPRMPKSILIQLYELERERWEWLPFFGYRSVRRRAEAMRQLSVMARGTAAHRDAHRRVFGCDPEPPAGFRP